MIKKKVTSWNNVAGWYDNLLEEKEGTYQKDLILPNLLRLADIKKGERILDLACGQGFFAREFANAGANVMGVDISPELIKIAQTRPAKSITYHIGSADNVPFVSNNSVGKIAIILALQNIENVQGVLKECARMLSDNGKIFIVLNHPAFRVPKRSSWGWDPSTSSGPSARPSGAEQGIQYRRIDAYLSESQERIQMHPGERPHDMTLSFHRPLQFYAKACAKAGFAIARIEEWNSEKKSEPGPRAKAENIARKEIPLFLFLEVVRYK